MLYVQCCLNLCWKHMGSKVPSSMLMFWSNHTFTQLCTWTVTVTQSLHSHNVIESVNVKYGTVRQITCSAFVSVLFSWRSFKRGESHVMSFSCRAVYIRWSCDDCWSVEVSSNDHFLKFYLILFEFILAWYYITKYSVKGIQFWLKDSKSLVVFSSSLKWGTVHGVHVTLGLSQALS